MTALTQSAPIPAAGDNHEPLIIPHYDNPDPSGHVTVTGPTTTHMPGRVRIRSPYGLHNRASRVTVIADAGLVMVEFRAGDADIMLCLAGTHLEAFTSALITSTPCTSCGCKR